MSPLELIRKGIVDKDWTNVIKGFNNLTGENIEITYNKIISTKKNNKKIKKNGQSKKPESPTDIFFSEGDYDDPRLIDSKPNLTNIDISFKQDIEIDNKIGKKISLRRPPKRYIKIECSSCHKKVDIDHNDIGLYNNGDVESTKPSFFCKNCGG